MATHDCIDLFSMITSPGRCRIEISYAPDYAKIVLEREGALDNFFDDVLERVRLCMLKSAGLIPLGCLKSSGCTCEQPCSQPFQGLRQKR